MAGRILASAGSVLLLVCVAAGARGDRALFDAHLHYDAADAQAFTPAEVVRLLRAAGVRRALVTGAPPAYAQRLYRADPQRIVPVLGVYQEYSDKQNWHTDKGLPDRVRRQLRRGPWQGIGELHLFAEHRHSPVLREIAQLAARHELPLLMHADPAVIDTLFEIEPRLTVSWAHAGTFPYPDLIADYLERYPTLYVDLSMRDGRIAPQGRIEDAWYNLFVRHPDRFFVGVDTYNTQRWQKYAKAIATIRHWLEQLPEDIAVRLAYRNAARVFGPAE